MQVRYRLEDQPPAPLAVLMTLQHVLAMFVGIITPPLLVARALGLAETEVASLVSLSLLAAGFATLVQVQRWGPLGSGLLAVQGTSITFVALAIETGKAGGLPLVFGMALAGSVVPMLVSRYIDLAQRLFPPRVCGTAVLLIGLSLIRVGLADLAGGRANPQFGSLEAWSTGLLVLGIIVLLQARMRGSWAAAALVLGIAGGYGVSLLQGQVHLEGVWLAPWVAVPRLFAYQPLHFDAGWLLPWCIGYLVVAIECIGELAATSALSGEPTEGEVFRARLRGGLLADGLNSGLTSLLGALPKTNFAQNNAIIAMSGVASRRIGVGVGLLLMTLGLFPKLAALVAAIPRPVLGGAAVIMFAMVAVAGLEMLAHEGLTARSRLLVAVSLALGLGVIMVPEALAGLHTATDTPSLLLRSCRVVLESGVAVGTLTAVVLNLLISSDEPGEAYEEAA